MNNGDDSYNECKKKNSNNDNSKGDDSYDESKKKNSQQFSSQRKKIKIEEKE
jgi:hypothetical protein